MNKREARAVDLITNHERRGEASTLTGPYFWVALFTTTTERDVHLFSPTNFIFFFFFFFNVSNRSKWVTTNRIPTVPAVAEAVP